MRAARAPLLIQEGWSGTAGPGWLQALTSFSNRTSLLPPPSLATDRELDPRPEIERQGRVSETPLIVLIQQVPDARIDRNAPVDVAPAVPIHQLIRVQQIAVGQ